jgi:hypothetical protein
LGKKCVFLSSVFTVLAGTVCTAAIIPANDPEVVKGLSSYNWVVMNDAISSSGGGSSFALKFQHTRHVALQVDTTAFAKLAPGRYPVVAWSVNGAAEISHQLLPGEETVELAADVASPKIEFYLKGLSPFEDRYNGDHPVNSVRITGFQVDDGGRAGALSTPKKRWLNFGDSIMSGDAAMERGGQGRPANDAWAASDDARASYGYLLARHFGYAESRVAYGGYDYGGGLARVPSLTKLADQITSTVSRLQNDLYQPAPDVIVINLGENGAPDEKSVTNALTRLRLRAGPSAKIIVMVPLSGKSRAQVTAAFNAYQLSSHDPKVYLVDLGPLKYETADGGHPTAAGHQFIYEAALPFFKKIIR